MGTGEDGGVVTKELPRLPADEGIIPRARRRMEEIVAVRRYGWIEIAEAIEKVEPEITKRMGSQEAFSDFCKVLAMMGNRHTDITPEFFADSITQNKDAIDKFYFKQIERYPRAPIYDIYSTTVSAVVVGNVFGINPAKLLAIARKESGFDTIAISENQNGTKDYGVCQINDTDNALATYRLSRDYWMKRLNAEIQKLGGHLLIAFPENIWPPKLAGLNPTANTWAAALTLMEKRAYPGVNKWVETFIAYNGPLGNENAKRYGNELAEHSTAIEREYGFKLIGSDAVIVRK